MNLSKTKNSTPATPTKCKFGDAVRNGRCGTDPRLVPEFIRSRTIASTEQSREKQLQVQVNIIELLFDTIADPLLAPCWRNWCFQCCCMPLHTLRCLSCTDVETTTTRKLEQEMCMLKQYYLPASSNGSGENYC